MSTFGANTLLVLAGVAFGTFIIFFTGNEAGFCGHTLFDARGKSFAGGTFWTESSCTTGLNAVTGGRCAVVAEVVLSTLTTAMAGLAIVGITLGSVSFAGTGCADFSQSTFLVFFARKVGAGTGQRITVRLE